MSGREDWKYVLVRNGALLVVIDGLKLTVRLSAMTLDMISIQVWSLTLGLHCIIVHFYIEVDYSPLRSATKSMPVFMSNVQCSDMDSSLLDCSYNRNSSNRDHSKDLGIKCKKCKWSCFRV